MPQSVTFSVGAKVEKGPEIKSEAKFDIATYGALVEEVVCKCNTSQTFPLPPFNVAMIDFILVASDKYMADKDCVPMAGGSMPEKKYIKYWFRDEQNNARELRRPDVIAGLNLPADVSTITFFNQLTVDVKVSVLIVQKYSPMKGHEQPDDQQMNQQQNGALPRLNRDAGYQPQGQIPTHRAP